MPHTPAAPPAGQTPVTQNQTPAPDPNPYADDPVYQQTIALANTNEKAAQAQAEASQKQLVIGLGSSSLANQLGLGADTAAAAQGNSYSILDNLLRGHNANEQAVDQNANHQNLTYSSAHDRGLQQEQTGYQSGQYQAYQLAQQQLGQIAAALLAARQAAAEQRNAAAGDAYQRNKNNPVVVQDPNSGGALSTLLRSYGG
jgi:hypothetical protein